MKVEIKRVVQSVLARFGYRVVRTSGLPVEAFDLQRRLIATHEPIVFDIGAHEGAVAALYREAFPRSTVHCFEPFPRAFEELERRFLSDPLTFCHGVAVSNTRGKASLNANRSAATNSLLATDARAASYWGDGLLDTRSKVSVDTTTVDGFCEAQAIAHIDILKIDVQGAEYAVLEGASETLSKRRVSLIYTELLTCPTYQGQHQLHEYLALLADLGYEFIDFFNPLRKGGKLLQADFIFTASKT